MTDQEPWYSQRLFSNFYRLPLFSIHRIAEGLGGYFSVFLVGSAAYNSVRGYFNTPAGLILRNRLLATGRVIRVKAPLRAVKAAAWSGIYDSVDCLLVSIRGGKVGGLAHLDLKIQES